MFLPIKDHITGLLTAAGVTGSFEFAQPPKPEMGDVAFPVFTLAKAAGKNPAQLAQEIAGKIAVVEGGMVEKVAAFGPYVNFFLRPGAVVETVVKAVENEGRAFGNNATGAGKKVLIEYPSNNTHKELHIGHFRNICIGNVLVQLYRKSGFEMHPVNYLNDFGAHVAKCLWGVTVLHAGEQPPENKQKWLGQIYAEASRYAKEHPEVEPEIAEIQKKLEAHDPSIWPLFIETREWSIEKFIEIFKELAVEHEMTFYESDIKAMGQQIVDELLEKKIATVGEGGAIIVDLREHGLEIALVRKSNGIGLYLTSDLPLAEEKFKKYDVDESIVITSHEQVFYFKQLYKILELMGFKKKLTHLSYGVVNRPEGKMSSRLGNVILYEDLRDEVYEAMVNETRARHAEWSDEKVESTAWRLAQAALKFDMQKHESIKNFTFDIKEATSVEGFSGPYVLYVLARINSLIRKAGGVAPADCALLQSPEEKKLALLLGQYAEVVEKALVNYNPSVICRYAFDVAQSFNEFYNKHSILNAEESGVVQARLYFAVQVKAVLENALGVLTIEPVDEM